MEFSSVLKSKLQVLIRNTIRFYINSSVPHCPEKAAGQIIHFWDIIVGLPNGKNGSLPEKLTAARQVTFSQSDNLILLFACLGKLRWENSRN
jgi:hypothetical protein